MLDKVRKLLAKAEATGVTPEEAETFTIKAEQLIAKYAIDQAVLKANNDTDKVTTKVFDVKAPHMRHKLGLLNAVGLEHRCQTVHTGKGRALVIGYPNDLEAVELIYASLLVQATNGAVQLNDEDFRAAGRKRAAFYVGFTSGVAKRFRDIRERAEGEAKSSTPGAELVLRDRVKDVDKVVGDMFPNLKTRRVTVSDLGGYSAGSRAGAKADIGTSRISGRKALTS
jgi:hypothetical protein